MGEVITASDLMHQDVDFADCYGQIYDFKNLYTSYKLAAKCKRNKRDVIDFEYNLAHELWKLHHELKEGTYKLLGYYHFKEKDICRSCPYTCG